MILFGLLPISYRCIVIARNISMLHFYILIILGLRYVTDGLLMFANITATSNFYDKLDIEYFVHICCIYTANYYR